VKRTQTYTIDGKTYDSLEAMPADVRRKWDALAKLVTTFTAGAAVSIRILSSLVALVLLPALLLAGLGLFTSVRITLAYGTAWWVAAAALWVALTAGLAWGFKRGVGATGGAAPSAFGKLMALTIGTTAISALAVFGGVPVLLHHLTARPGELVVSVTQKKTAGGRYTCTPQLIIAEFTFPLRNHLCPGRRAYAEIQVGSRIRLEGEVSEFGVTPDVFSWSQPR
jgi:hypothetical protein